MKIHRLILRQYFMSTVGSLTCYIIYKVATTPDDCGQCHLLTLVWAAMLFLLLASANILQFLLLMRKRKAWMVPLTTIVPAILVVFHIIKTYYKTDSDYPSTDMWMILSGAIPNVLFNIFTCIIVTRRINNCETNGEEENESVLDA